MKRSSDWLFRARLTVDRFYLLVTAAVACLALAVALALGVML